MKIAIGCDHIVTDIKNSIVNLLKELGHQIIDCGTYDFERTHYPIYGKRVAEHVVLGKADKGIVLCGTGVGITNAVNKVKGARCALVGDVATTIYAREQLDMNVLGLGGRVLGIGAIEDIIEAFLTTAYKPDKETTQHIREIDEMIQNTSYIGDEHFFDEFLDKWDRGEYHD